MGDGLYAAAYGSGRMRPVSNPPADVELRLGAGTQLSHLARALPGTVETGLWRSADRWLLDTFDGRLIRKGLALWCETGPRQTGSVRLVLEGGPRSATTTVGAGAGDRKNRLLAHQLGSGTLAQVVVPLIDERALLPRVRVRSRRQDWRVCNGDGKTVARLEIVEPLGAIGALRGRRATAVEGTAAAMERRLMVRPVLGYDREMRRVLASLAGKGGPTPSTRTLAEEALEAVGLPAAGFSSEVDVSLDATMPAAEATVSICRRLAEVVEANLAGTIDDLDPEFLHDLRVAIRRSRSVLKEMGRVLAPDDLARSRADLRWIQEVTGPTRDLDVLLHEWPDLASPVPETMQGYTAPLLSLLREDRSEAFATMRRHLRSRRYGRSWAAWKDVLGGGKEHSGADATVPIGPLAARRILTVHRAMLEMGSAITGDSPPDGLHDLRKKGKELRYLLELFGGMWPSERVRPLVTALKGLQDALGHFQDDEVQVREMRGLGPRLASMPGGTDALLALGFVVDGLAARQRQARDEFSVRFREFAARDQRRLVRDTFTPALRGRRR